MQPKSIRFSSLLGVIGTVLAVGVGGWLAFSPHSPESPPSPVASSAPPSSRSLAAPTAGKRYALLVGVGAYRYADAKHLSNLAGPPQDVQALAQVLKSRWGFDAITVLQNAEATRANILQQLDDLTRIAAPGSHVLFYYSGHGTSRQDPKSGLPLPYTSGALLAYDSNINAASKAADILNSLIMGSRDLRPRFEALDHKGVYVTAWLDACFSENSSYRLITPAQTGSRRYEPLPPLDFGAFGSDTVGYQPYPYHNVVTFAASAANQPALDIDQRIIQTYPTLDGHYHGAFSDALLRALTDRALPGYGALDKNADGIITVEELYSGVTSFMSERHYDHTPKLQPIQAEDASGERNRPLFQVSNPPQPAAATTLTVAAPTLPPTALPVTFTGPADESRQLASLPRLKLVATGAELTVTARDGGYELHDAAGATIGNIASFNALKEALRRRALLNPLITAARQTGQATVGLELASAYATNRLPLSDTQNPVRVWLTLKTDQAGYPMLLDLFGDGVAQWLYPSAKEQEYRKRWPAEHSRPLLCIGSRPPVGIDTVYAFVLAQPLLPDLVQDAGEISSANGGKFDALIEQLSQPGRVLGADRLALEIYTASLDELQAWPEKECK